MILKRKKKDLLKKLRFEAGQTLSVSEQTLDEFKKDLESREKNLEDILTNLVKFNFPLSGYITGELTEIQNLLSEDKTLSKELSKRIMSTILLVYESLQSEYRKEKALQIKIPVEKLEKVAYAINSDDKKPEGYI